MLITKVGMLKQNNKMKQTLSQTHNAIEETRIPGIAQGESADPPLGGSLGV